MGCQRPNPLGRTDDVHRQRRLRKRVGALAARVRGDSGGLEQYARRIEGEFDAILAGEFRVHGELLRSLFASGELEREQRECLLTAEAAVGPVLQWGHGKIEAIENQSQLGARVGASSACSGLIDMRAQAELPSALRADTPRAIRLLALRPPV
jgi:hypothetical protein